MYDPGTSNEWKACVIHAVRGNAGLFAAGIPVRCDLTFYLPRPKAHYGSGKNANVLKGSAPTRPTGKPDRDNLDKAVCDAITAAGVWVDDSQVTSGTIRKRYCLEGQTGCEIYITEDVECTTQSRFRSLRSKSSALVTASNSTKHSASF